ncbi:hypothetical protein DFH09DRAFT_1095098 [Mycena vulgaris]|nr:hypothetical protein DFH09DRAFT_1095098 [Mycena vulgaris]
MGHWAWTQKEYASGQGMTFGLGPTSFRAPGVGARLSEVDRGGGHLNFWFHVQFGTDPQEAKAIAAPCQPALDPDYGREGRAYMGEHYRQRRKFDTKNQTFDEESGLYIGKYPSMLGRYSGLYENRCGCHSRDG